MGDGSKKGRSRERVKPEGKGGCEDESEGEETRSHLMTPTLVYLQLRLHVRIFSVQFKELLCFFELQGQNVKQLFHSNVSNYGVWGMTTHLLVPL